MSRDGFWSFGAITRHSIVLVVAGFSYVAMGFSIEYIVPGGPRWLALVVARNVMSLDLWGYVFMTLGLLVALLAHWPNRARTWGYTILTGLSVAWSMFYFLGVFFVDQKGSNISLGFVWGLQGFVWWAISGLPDIAANGKGRMPLWIKKEDTPSHMS